MFSLEAWFCAISRFCHTNTNEMEMSERIRTNVVLLRCRVFCFTTNRHYFSKGFFLSLVLYSIVWSYSCQVEEDPVLQDWTAWTHDFYEEDEKNTNTYNINMCSTRTLCYIWVRILNSFGWRIADNISFFL